MADNLFSTDSAIYGVLLIVTTLGGNIFVGLSMKRFIDETLPQGFPSAGKYIGILERLLFWIILTIGQATLIGFLLTIKAIYRFGDIQGENTVKMKLSEYFIVGTLLSLAWTLALWGLWLIIKNQ